MIPVSALMVCFGGRRGAGHSALSEFVEVATVGARVGGPTLAPASAMSKANWRQRPMAVRGPGWSSDLAPAAAKRGKFRAALDNGGRLAVAIATAQLKVARRRTKRARWASVACVIGAARRAGELALGSRERPDTTIASVPTSTASVGAPGCPMGGTGAPLLWLGTLEVRPGAVITPKGRLVAAPR
jgi:hypothetical protein